MQVIASLYECKHCSGTGTCANGKNSSSCYACAKRNELWFWQLSKKYGLMCGSCGGIGKAEPMTERLNKRIAPLLALMLTFGILGIITFATITKSPYFSELLAFGSAIIGAVAGYYFSRTKGDL